MRGLMFGWAMCEEILMVFRISITQRIRKNFGILGIWYRDFSVFRLLLSLSPSLIPRFSPKGLNDAILSILNNFKSFRLSRYKSAFLLALGYIDIQKPKGFTLPFSHFKFPLGQSWSSRSVQSASVFSLLSFKAETILKSSRSHRADIKRIVQIHWE